MRAHRLRRVRAHRKDRRTVDRVRRSAVCDNTWSNRSRSLADTARPRRQHHWRIARTTCRRWQCNRCRSRICRPSRRLARTASAPNTSRAGRRRCTADQTAPAAQVSTATCYTRRLRATYRCTCLRNTSVASHDAHDAKRRKPLTASK